MLVSGFDVKKMYFTHTAFFNIRYNFIFIKNLGSSSFKKKKHLSGILAKFILAYSFMN